jgi:hypothetical protein
VFHVLIHLLAAAILVLIPTIWLGEPTWRAERSMTAVALLFALAYFGFAIYLLVSELATKRASLERIPSAGVVSFGGAFMLLAIVEWL